MDASPPIILVFGVHSLFSCRFFWKLPYQDPSKRDHRLLLYNHLTVCLLDKHETALFTDPLFSNESPEYNMHFMCILIATVLSSHDNIFQLCSVPAANLFWATCPIQISQLKNTVWDGLASGMRVQVNHWHLDNNIWFKPLIIYEGMLNTHLKCSLYKSRIR